jgi:hypothetical protein
MMMGYPMRLKMTKTIMKTITKEELKTKTICVMDNGLFVSFARKIAPAFKKCYYYSPWQCAFPQSRAMVVGDGFDEIERIKQPLDKADEIDLWVFLDLYQGDLQTFLESHGARVWGCRHGEEIEMYRWEFHNHLKRLGLPTPQVDKIIGMAALREKLQSVKDKYIKTSIVRGDFETFHHQTYELSEPRLDELEHSLGVVKNNYKFLVESSIPDAVEIGYDGFTIDGKYPSHAMMAYEVKDVGMIGTALEYSRLAKPVRDVNSALSETLKGYNYRGFLSTEIRYTKEYKPYLIDPCCRLGTPSNELLQELFDGWPEVLWHGAVGELVSPKIKSKFGVLAVIHTEWAVDNWQSVSYPRELDNDVKLRFHTRVDDKDYIAPQVIGLPDVGYVCGTGNTLIQAIDSCKDKASQIKGFQLKVSLEGIESALDTIKEGEKLGIKFTDQPLPTLQQLKGSGKKV